MSIVSIVLSSIGVVLFFAIIFYNIISRWPEDADGWALDPENDEITEEIPMVDTEPEDDEITEEAPIVDDGLTLESIRRISSKHLRRQERDR
jgi:hypothetical protein